MATAIEFPPIEWIDEYVARLRDYVFVREEDGLLIRAPNEAHKLNAGGVRVLKRLLDGESVLDLWTSYGSSPDVRRDLYAFFVGLKQVLQGCVNERRLPEGVTTRPFALGFNTLPVLSELAVTYRCNLACRFCYAGCSCKKEMDGAGEVSAKDACRILDIVRREAQTPSISFTGGEPLLRDDLLDLVRHARHDLGMRVNLITNGTLIDAATARSLRDAGLHSAQVSLESPDAAIHDALTQVDGSYRASVAAIGHLREAGVSVHTNTTVNRVNRESAMKMPEFVRAMGLERFSMNLVIPAVRGGNADIYLTYTEAAAFIPRIREEARRNGVEFMWYSPTPLCIFNPVAHQLGNKGCAACDGLLSVSPTGDVLPCSSWPEPVGNLLDGPFRAIWDSARGRWLREKRFAPDVCRACEDFALCQSGCPLYWRHFGYAELDGAAALRSAKMVLEHA
jgi:radical SAM protein with 4Fe4S-binding SPASM domain